MKGGTAGWLKVLCALLAVVLNGWLLYVCFRKGWSGELFYVLFFLMTLSSGFLLFSFLSGPLRIPVNYLACVSPMWPLCAYSLLYLAGQRAGLLYGLAAVLLFAVPLIRQITGCVSKPEQVRDEETKARMAQREREKREDEERENKVFDAVDRELGGEREEGKP